MDKQQAPDNRDQIIRKDARGCFVEVKSDCFHLGKIHMQFVTYDQNRPKGQRYTNNIHIYIDLPEFLVLEKEAQTGALHARMMQYKQSGNKEPLYEHLGGTSAEQLKRYNKERPDGKSLSRVVKLTCGGKSDYFLVADSGPGDQTDKGIIIPRFGKNPEQHVAISLTWRQVNELLFTTSTHYQAWLSAKYMAEWSKQHAPRLNEKPREQTAERPSVPQSSTGPATAPSPPKQPAASQPTGFASAFGSVYGMENGRNRADDTRMF